MATGEYNNSIRTEVAETTEPTDRAHKFWGSLVSEYELSPVLTGSHDSPHARFRFEVTNQEDQPIPETGDTRRFLDISFTPSGASWDVNIVVIEEHKGQDNTLHTSLKHAGVNIGNIDTLVHFNNYYGNKLGFDTLQAQTTNLKGEIVYLTLTQLTYTEYNYYLQIQTQTGCNNKQ